MNKLNKDEIKLLDPDKASRHIFILNSDEQTRIKEYRKEQKKIEQNKYYKLLLSL